MLKNSFLALNANKKSEIEDVFSLFVRSKKIKTLVLVSKDLENLWNTFISMFKRVEAAGGLVKNENGEFLMIHRKGSWDLPKGKLDKGESIEECSIREVEEECGISDIKLKEKLVTTYHIYSLDKNPCIKPSHWFNMEVKGSPELTPQKEEDIEKAKWIKPKKVPDLLEKAYPSIREVFESLDTI